jgi:hypothetical protein
VTLLRMRALCARATRARVRVTCVRVAHGCTCYRLPRWCSAWYRKVHCHVPQDRQTARCGCGVSKLRSSRRSAKAQTVCRARLPHRHRDWACPCHIGTGTGLVSPLPQCAAAVSCIARCALYACASWLARRMYAAHCQMPRGMLDVANRIDQPVRPSRCRCGESTHCIRVGCTAVRAAPRRVIVCLRCRHLVWLHTVLSGCIRCCLVAYGVHVICHLSGARQQRLRQRPHWLPMGRTGYRWAALATDGPHWLPIGRTRATIGRLCCAIAGMCASLSRAQEDRHMARARPCIYTCINTCVHTNVHDTWHVLRPRAHSDTYSTRGTCPCIQHTWHARAVAVVTHDLQA